MWQQTRLFYQSRLSANLNSLIEECHVTVLFPNIANIRCILGSRPELCLYFKESYVSVWFSVSGSLSLALFISKSHHLSTSKNWELFVSREDGEYWGRETTRMVKQASALTVQLAHCYSSLKMKHFRRQTALWASDPKHHPTLEITLQEKSPAAVNKCLEHLTCKLLSPLFKYLYINLFHWDKQPHNGLWARWES